MISTSVEIVNESGIVPAQESSRPLDDDDDTVLVDPRPSSSTKIMVIKKKASLLFRSSTSSVGPVQSSTRKGIQRRTNAVPALD